MLYAFLRSLTGIALQWFYRDIEVMGAERIPRRGPLLVAMNHPNSLIDALVAVHVVPRRLIVTAKATLWQNFFLRQLFNRGIVLPLRRASDELERDAQQRFDPARNEGSFHTILDALAREQAVLIFPEGRSHGEPALAALRTGLARIALQARDVRGIGGLAILPVGLTFETKWKPRSRIFVHVAAPILLDGWNADGDAVRGLTGEVERRMEGVTLNFPTADVAERVIGVSRILARAFDQARPLEAPEPPLADEVAIARRVGAVREALPPGESERTDRFLARLEAFRAELASRSIPAGDVEVPTRLSRATWFAIREGAIVLAAGPVALWGRINHCVPLGLARWASRRWSKTPQDPAVYELGVGLGLVPLAYIIQAAIVWSIAGPLWMALYLVSLPVAETWDIRFRDRLRRAVQRVRTYFQYRRDPNLQPRLASEFSWLREEAARLEHQALCKRR
jgi:glycerol-3-phosphate O-acyltransferase/dihydroxyacetone phosphate acyltransferase